MALEELLRQQDPKESEGAAAAAAETRERLSLIRQAGAMVGTAAESDALPADGGEGSEPVVCPDGYVRRSPVQPYRTPEDYYKRKARRIAGIAAGVVLAVLLVIALVRAKVFRL